MNSYQILVDPKLHVEVADADHYPILLEKRMHFLEVGLWREAGFIIYFMMLLLLAPK